MIWWYWMVLGLALLGAEMTTPGGFYILFFGLSALIVGTLAGLDVVQTDWLQWLLFSVIAVLSLLLFRGPLLARISDERKGQPDIDSMVGETAIPLETLAVGDTVSLPVSNQVKGVSVDIDGFVWAVAQDDTRAYKIDPDTYSYEFYDGLNGPYTYSDMTGGAINNVTCNPPEG